MSGGGDIPKAPDLSQNIDQGNQIYSTAMSSAKQTADTADAYNKNAQANLSGVTDLSNSMAGQIGSAASTNLNTYGSAFVPLQQKQATDAANYTSDANVERLKGMAVADANAGVQATRANSAAALAAEGVDPGSIHGGALDRQAGIADAAQVAGAGTQSVLNTENTGRQMVANANQLGLQLNQAGTSGAATGAGVAQSGQSTINQTNASGISNLGASNQFLNTGVSGNNSSLQAANTQFQDQAQSAQMKADQQSSALSAVGSIAGAAMMFMEEGGSVPHSGLPVRAGHTSPAAGIPVKFEDMDHGGGVSARGALPVGAIPGTTDRKPAMLTPGEFVVPQDVAHHKGHEFFHRLIDKTREEINTRRAIPVNHPPHMSMS